MMYVEDGRYYLCGKEMDWTSGFTFPRHMAWDKLSPHDWMVVLDSISLVWNQKRFVEDFGPEMVKLQAALTKFRCGFTSLFGMYFNPDRNADPHHRICLHIYRELLKARGAATLTKIAMPDSLMDPSHWGFLAWEYVGFCEDRCRRHDDRESNNSKRKVPEWKPCSSKKRRAVSESEDNRNSVDALTGDVRGSSTTEQSREEQEELGLWKQTTKNVRRGLRGSLVKARNKARKQLARKQRRLL
jgi:hypothetical protein